VTLKSGVQLCITIINNILIYTQKQLFLIVIIFQNIMVFTILLITSIRGFLYYLTDTKLLNGSVTLKFYGVCSVQDSYFILFKVKVFSDTGTHFSTT